MPLFDSPLPRVLLEGQPAASALLRGDGAHPALMGEALFYPWQTGTLAVLRVAGLPEDGLYPLHIHRNGNCRTGGDVPFYCAGMRQASGYSQLAPVLGYGGTAFSVCYTGHFTPEQIVGRALVHQAVRPADRVACGVIAAMPWLQKKD